MQRRKFSLGSEWVYFKIYCGVKTADIILEESIVPLLADLAERKLIFKWFFVRYNDPKPHLRLRLQLSDFRNYNKILEITNSKIKVSVDSGLISNIVMESYVRELDRYGKNTIEFAEDLFCNSSELVLHFLDYDDEEKLVVLMFYMEQVFSEIKISSTEKMEWINQSNNAFKNEFNSDKNLNSQLKRKFLDFKTKYQEFLFSNDYEEIRGFIVTNISHSVSALEKIMENERDFLASFFQSIFHMHINRTFISRQRLFEMVVYDYLFRFNKTKVLKM